ncbi:uncharacterized protein LOC113360495 [Papaver somniferum]|uniref:uncharacterized protein LOC113360495 n=1 Tax=Papaver somniferum TaxID=3469 RepID=UPI000E6FB1C6|nr:uncharacterized protein LOC113360495 [Papaver somniferum]
MCESLVKLLGDSSPDKLARSEIFTQLDPTVNAAFDCLEFRRLFIQAEGFSEYCSTIQEITRQNAKLRADVHVGEIITEKLRNNNQELRVSEKSNQLLVQKLRSDLAKPHKNLRDLASTLSSSCDRAERRQIYLEQLMKIYVKNAQKDSARETHLQDKAFADEICISNSLPLEEVCPLDISDNEVVPQPDSDFDYDSCDEEIPLPEDQPMGDEAGGNLLDASNSEAIPHVEVSAKASIPSTAPDVEAVTGAVGSHDEVHQNDS